MRRRRRHRTTKPGRLEYIATTQHTLFVSNYPYLENRILHYRIEWRYTRTGFIGRDGEKLPPAGYPEFTVVLVSQSADRLLQEYPCNHPAEADCSQWDRSTPVCNTLYRSVAGALEERSRRGEISIVRYLSRTFRGGSRLSDSYHCSQIQNYICHI